MEEKKRDWEDFKTQEKKKDKIMELERLKKIKEQQEVEAHKHEEALKGREVIVDQIKQREIERVKQKEEQEREAQVLVQRMKDMEKEDKLKYEVTVP
jgi:beta-phosphoglucomutase-like phosphatase (HAD superfamily)